MTPIQKKGYFPALTGLRALAASLVFFHHFNPFPQESFLFGVVNEFHIGVTIFFVLSGFLITYRYKDTFELKSNWLKRYFINRFARIYPVFFMITSLTFLVRVLKHSNAGGLKTLLLNLTLLKGFSAEYYGTLVSQAWSLSVEEVFYLSCPFIFLAYKRFKFPLLLVPLILISAGLGLRELSLISGIPILSGGLKFVLSYTFFGRSFEFILGMILALQIDRFQIFKYKYNTAIGLFATISFGKVLDLVKGNQKFGVSTYEGILLNNLVLPFAIVLLISGLANEKGHISRFFATRGMDILGKSSYTFYLIHMGIFSSLLQNTLHLPDLLCFLVLWGISFGIYTYFEEPMNHRIRKMGI